MSCKHAPGIHVCSWVDAEGQAVVKGRTYRWQFSERFGPTFVDVRGEPLELQPGPRSIAFRAFEQWLNELRQDRSGVLSEVKA